MKKIFANKYIVWFLKLAFVLGAWVYVYFKFSQVSFDISLIFNYSRFSFEILFLLIILMGFNWLTEIIKWRALVSKITQISLYQSFKGVCVGMSLAFVTPNRIGEIGGRGLVLQSNYKKVVYATFLGSIMQFITTILFSVLGFLLLVYYTDKYDFFAVWFNSFISILLGVSVLIVFIPRKKKQVVLYKIIGKKIYLKLRKVQQLFDFNDYIQALALSIIRYLIFASQFAILVVVLIPDLTFVYIVIGICLTYFFTTIIPTSLLGEIGIRGSVAMAIFGLFTTHELIVFQISILIWLINFVIPTLLGSVFLMKIKKGNSN